MQVQPYLFFEGQCEQAIEFYEKALGAKVQRLLRFKDCPEPPNKNCSGSAAPHGDKVMHASLEIGQTQVLVSDGRCQSSPEFKGFSLTLTVEDEEQVEKMFNALLDGGQILMPLDKTFFASKFGMVKDRFGVTWIVLAK